MGISSIARALRTGMREGACPMEAAEKSMDAPPTQRSARRARLIIAAALLVYLLALIGLRDQLGPVAYWLCALPVVAIGWWYGPVTGAVGGTLCILLHRGAL